MSMRVTSAEVKAIINTTLTGTELDPFINSANLVVTEQLGDEGLSDDQLKDIELWLSAHFVAIRSPQNVREKIGDAEVWYESKLSQSGMGFGITRYGQTAIALDPTGKLTNVGKKKVSFIAIDLGLD